MLEITVAHMKIETCAFSKHGSWSKNKIMVMRMQRSKTASVTGTFSLYSPTVVANMHESTYGGSFDLCASYTNHNGSNNITEGLRDGSQYRMILAFLDMNGNYVNLKGLSLNNSSLDQYGNYTQYNMQLSISGFNAYQINMIPLTSIPSDNYESTALLYVGSRYSMVTMSNVYSLNASSFVFFLLTLLPWDMVV